MVTRYGNCYTEDAPNTQDSPSLHLMPKEHPMLEREHDSTDKYFEKTDTCHPVADLLEQFLTM